MTLPFMLCCKTTILFLIIPTKLQILCLPPHRNQKFWGFQKVIHFFESRVQSIILIAHLFKDVSNYVSAINLNSQFKNSGHIYICARSFILFHGIPDKFRENRPIPFFLYMHALNRIFSLEISVFILQRVIDIHIFCVIFFGQFFDSRVCFSDLWVGAHKKAGRLSPGTGSDRSDQSSARSECQGNSDRWSRY